MNNHCIICDKRCRKDTTIEKHFYKCIHNPTAEKISKLIIRLEEKDEEMNRKEKDYKKELEELLKLSEELKKNIYEIRKII